MSEQSTEQQSGESRAAHLIASLSEQVWRECAALVSDLDGFSSDEASKFIPHELSDIPETAASSYLRFIAKVAEETASLVMSFAVLSAQEENSSEHEED